MTAFFSPGPDVHVVIPDEETSTTVYVATMPDGPILVLQDEAGLIWLEATRSSPDDWLGRVARRAEASEAEVEPSARSFVDDLVARQLLVPEAPS